VSPSSLARRRRSALKAPQIKVFTPWSRNTCNRWAASRWGRISSWLKLSRDGSSGKICIREHQFKTGATRLRNTGIASMALPVGELLGMTFAFPWIHTSERKIFFRLAQALKQISCQVRFTRWVDSIPLLPVSVQGQNAPEI
jgi:hypothetical protein